MEQDLVERIEPLLFHVIGITEESITSFHGLNFKNMNPAISGFLRRCDSDLRAFSSAGLLRFGVSILVKTLHV